MTIKQIANKLGVSASTVSRALNNSHEISLETRQRISDFALQVGFRKNPNATSLRRGVTKTIAVIVPDISNYFFTIALNAIEEVANESKYHVLVYQTNDSYEKEVEIAKELMNGRVDGVLISVAVNTVNNFSHIESLLNIVPVILFDRVYDNPELPSFTCNDEESGFVATQHLIDKGCKNILFIGISDGASVTRERLKGYCCAIENNSISIKRENILLCKNQSEAEEVIRNGLINLKPDAVFSTVERYTLLLYAQCRELLIQVPGELKVISFSNSVVAPLLAPALSTIAQPAAQMGQAAVVCLIGKIKMKKKYRDDNVCLKCSFHYRESSS